MNWSEYFVYDTTSPSCLRWKNGKSNGKHLTMKPGDIAGCLSRYKGKGGLPRWVVTFNGKEKQVHRIIWEMFNGTIPEGMVIDHLSGDPSDNQLSNLECKTREENMQNKKGCSNNTSGKTGVSIQKRNGEPYVIKAYYFKSGKMILKCFSVTTLGYAEAFSQACSWRDEQMRILKENGSKHTERHGSLE